MRSLTNTLLCGMLAFAAGCTTPAADLGGSSSQAEHAQCLVCKSEGDLACVDVTVRADTPRTEYMGRTYYFCSVQCRKEFEKEPQRYVGQ